MFCFVLSFYRSISLTYFARTKWFIWFVQCCRIWLQKFDSLLQVWDMALLLLRRHTDTLNFFDFSLVTLQQIGGYKFVSKIQIRLVRIFRFNKRTMKNAESTYIPTCLFNFLCSFDFFSLQLIYQLIHTNGATKRIINYIPSHMHKHIERRQTDRAQNWNFSLFALLDFSERTNERYAIESAHTFELLRKLFWIAHENSIFLFDFYLSRGFFSSSFVSGVWFGLRFSFESDDVQFVCVALCSIFSEMNFYKEIRFSSNFIFKLRKSRIPTTNGTDGNEDDESSARTIAFDLLNAYTEFEFHRQRNGSTSSVCVSFFSLFFLLFASFFFRFVSLLLPLPLLLHAQRAHTQTDRHSRSRTQRRLQLKIHTLIVLIGLISFNHN